MFRLQKEYKVDEFGLIWSKGHLQYVPEGGDLRSGILAEFHRVSYSGHLGYPKMISTVKRHFFWPKLKADVAMFITKC